MPGLDGWVDEKVDGVVDGFEEGKAALLEVEQGDDALLTDENTLLVLCDRDGLQFGRAGDWLPGPVIIPVDSIWQVHWGVHGGVVNKVLLCGSACLRGHQELIAEHELLVEGEGHLVLRELVPHGSDDWGALLGSVLESRVEVVSLRVSLVNRIEDDLLDSLGSGPGLTVIESVDVSVCSEEWVEDAYQVLLNKVVVCWSALEAWQVGTAEDHAGHTKRKSFLDVKLDVGVVDLAVTSPHGSVAL